MDVGITSKPSPPKPDLSITVWLVSLGSGRTKKRPVQCTGRFCAFRRGKRDDQHSGRVEGDASVSA
jgi:hypothetical protein